MKKRIGDIEISGTGNRWQIRVHHNTSIHETIEIKSEEDLRDLEYAISVLVKTIKK